MIRISSKSNFFDLILISAFILCFEFFNKTYSEVFTFNLPCEQLRLAVYWFISSKFLSLAGFRNPLLILQSSGLGYCQFYWAIVFAFLIFLNKIEVTKKGNCLIATYSFGIHNTILLIFFKLLTLLKYISRLCEDFTFPKPLILNSPLTR